MDLFRYTILKNYNKCTSQQEVTGSFTDTFEVKPSIYKEEMQLTTEQRSEKIIKTLFKSKTRNTTHLDVFPDVVVYQNFKEILTYSILVTAVNVSKNLCPLRVIFEKSPFFHITFEHSLIPDKLAQGMELQFSIHFTPELIHDYSHRVKILTPTEEYIIPIIAVGPRPIFAIPDHIHIAECPVNIGGQRSLLVKNIGEVPGVFNIHTPPPFSVVPSSGILDPNKAIQLTFTFKSFHSKYYKDVVKIKLESGETLLIDIDATSKCIDVVLNKNVVNFDNTYMGLKASHVIEIQNNSEYTIRYSWRKYFSYKKEYDIEETMRSELFEKSGQDTFEMVEPEENEIIRNRIYQDNLNQHGASEQLLFTHPHFIILSTTGEIWPNSTSDVTIIFSPEKVEDYECIAYCNISGIEERLQLTLHGSGIATKFELSLDTLSLAEIYLHSLHRFEIAVQNIGNIPGKLSYVDKVYEFGSNITCVPSSVNLLPFHYGAFSVDHYSLNEGAFIEEIQFRIEHSNEILKVFVKGTVLYPLITVTETEMNFGTVSLGFPISREIELCNLTYIAIPYNVRIVPDGSKIATKCSVDYDYECVLPMNPKEFECSVTSEIMPPNSVFSLKVTLTPNIVRLQIVTLEITTWNSPSYKVQIKVMYDARLPELVCLPPDISIRFSFINYPCQRLIKIKNKTNLNGNIQIFPEISSGLSIETDISKADVESHGTIEVMLNIICVELGRQTSTIKLQLFGGELVDICMIECVGQGPVVSIVPDQLNFNEVKLLRNCSETVHISNDSPIAADVVFKVYDLSVLVLNAQA